MKNGENSDMMNQEAGKATVQADRQAVPRMAAASGRVHREEAVSPPVQDVPAPPAVPAMDSSVTRRAISPAAPAGHLPHQGADRPVRADHPVQAAHRAEVVNPPVQAAPVPPAVPVVDSQGMPRVTSPAGPEDQATATVQAPAAAARIR